MFLLPSFNCWFNTHCVPQTVGFWAHSGNKCDNKHKNRRLARLELGALEPN